MNYKIALISLISINILHGSDKTNALELLKKNQLNPNKNHATTTVLNKDIEAIKQLLRLHSSQNK